MIMSSRRFILLAMAAGLAGCADTQLFSGKQAPDELSVIEGPPLYLPPNFDVRPPSEMAARPHENTNTQGKAQEIITGHSVNNSAPAAASNDWLVKSAGGDARDAGIRARLDAEENARQAVQKKEEDKGFFGRVFNRSSGDEEAVDEAGRVILDETAPDAGNYQKQ